MKDRIQRIEYIRKSQEAADRDQNRPTHTIRNWRGKNILYPKIIQVDVDYLMFRIENSRTEIQQMKYLRENPTLPRDLFKDPESSLAQEVQEAILSQINKSAGKDFLDDLRDRGQEDAAIITFDGYLVNGNRRTAALKSLDQRYVSCVVLPDDATPRDIYELEQELQISQDFREPYHWINELRNIRRGIEDKRYDFKEAEMAKRLRIDSRELKSKLRMLDLIDSFLSWKGFDNQYDYIKLDDTEQIFIQLEKAGKRYKDPEVFRELRNAVFTLIEERPSKGRLYGYVSDLIKHFDLIYDKMQKDFIESSSEQIYESNKPTSGNLLDSILDGEVEGKKQFFNEHTKSPENSNQLIEKIADVKALLKEKSDSEAVYESVSVALRELQGLSIDDDTAKTESIKSKLEQIIAISSELLAELI
ncbi:hypothetical protein [Fluviicola sp.]|uniref:hypothetical protein n=1 Tax=Fluviicola sp. TaxID=1917219 RepID=UPI0031E1E2F1